MTASAIAPFGSWKSPITSDLIVAGTISLGQIAIDHEDIYWSEMRPTEAGRNVIVRQSTDGKITDITPTPLNVRTRVHEYGGGAYVVEAGVVYFSNFADQRLYRQPIDKEPEAITPEAPMRYADAVVDRSRHRLICVCEDHSGKGEPVNSIASVSIESGEVTVLASGFDFYAAPRLSPDGAKLAWICWNHPNMPWDGTELWLADVQTDGSIVAPVRIAGGISESIFQPEWSPDNVLYFVSDRTGWWNLYRWRNESNASQPGSSEPLCEKSAEFGLPHWIFRMCTYGFESAQSLICTYVENGIQHIARLDTKTLDLTEIPIPYASVSGLRVGAGFAVFGAGSPTMPGVITRLDLQSGEVTVLRRSSGLEIDPGYLSIPEAIEFPTENGLSAYGFYYAPKNRDFAAPAGDRPPLLVKSHGGPTAATSPNFNPSIQYWTSRGFAILDVNYGGSTGYGRAYRERLKDCWGIVDVDDCVNGAKYLVDRGLVDGDRLCIDGGSAGGYTTLAALTFRDLFKAGASFYGVSDLEALATDTHKFESRYLDGLIGAYPARKDLYHQRSPIHAVDRLSCPVIFFQGDEDKIVPPNQAEMMVNALRQKGLPVAYVLFAGEQHGFRKAENIKRTLDGEFYFYSRVFGFEPEDAIEPVAIENL
ncbi:S9 family peptidase [Microcoleus sp. FACHB-1515]|uniref:S9 family peptidase n=1 Tax=Cyanophyceae TaxID=3028117 RepID=UPI001686171C|nr:S9 family peptidase [Microcoleus sp. FACHB-1515]MBD2090955.1 S9 family peptidase [Microcoleus sp. FACHB-1515]